MEFDPRNKIIKLCIQGMLLEEKGSPVEAGVIFQQAWNESEDDFEKFMAAYNLARVQEHASGKLQWFETALELAQAINNDAVKGAFPTIYNKVAQCYKELGNEAQAEKYEILAHACNTEITDSGPFYHGTRADLNTGDMLTPGGVSNYEPGLIMNHIYFTALPNGAGLAAALAKGDGRERVYIVETTGSFENDPNVTDKKFPGNPTRSYRTTFPLKIIGEVTGWGKQSTGDINEWRGKLASNNGKIIN